MVLYDKNLACTQQYLTALSLFPITNFLVVCERPRRRNSATRNPSAVFWIIFSLARARGFFFVSLFPSKFVAQNKSSFFLSGFASFVWKALSRNLVCCLIPSQKTTTKRFWRTAKSNCFTTIFISISRQDHKPLSLSLWQKDPLAVIGYEKSLHPSGLFAATKQNRTRTSEFRV